MSVKQQFRQAIRHGKGRTHILMRANPDVDFSAIIGDAAVKNYSYDIQCEGTRAGYLAELINMCEPSKRAGIIDRVLKQLWEERNDYWLLEQLFDLAAIFAVQGYEKAKKAIYKRFERRKIESCDAWGIEALWKADGMEGLKHSCRIFGKRLLKEPDYWCLGASPASFQKSYPGVGVYSELERAAKNDPDLQRYLEFDKRIQTQSSPKAKPQKRRYRFVLEFLKPDCRYGPFVLRNVKLTEKQIETLADDFLQEQDLKRKERFLLLFSKVKFPYDPAPLLQMARGKNPSKSCLVEYAIQSLRFFSSKDIRKFAVERIKNSRQSWCYHAFFYLPLFQENYRAGDHVLLREIIEKTKDQHKLHALASSIIDIYHVNETPKCRGPLEMIYDRVLCTYERREAVEILLKHNLLSKRIREEIPFDCNPEIRALACE